MVTVERVSTSEGFGQLELVWNRLLQASTSDAVTLTHEWLTTWWDVFAEGRELYILVAREGGEVIGIAPMLLRPVRHYGVLPFRRMEFLASGEDERDEICSDYLDFMLLRGREREALGAIWDYLLQHESEWDEVLLTDVSGESPNLPLAKELAAERGLSWQVTREQICAYLPIPASHDDLMAGLSGQYRKRIRKDRNTALKQDVQVEAVADLEGFGPAFDILIRLHQERWTSRGMPGSFASEKFTRFHRELAPKLLSQGWAKLWVLRLDGEPLCALYDFVYGNKIYYYQSGMSLKDTVIRSPGLLLRDRSLDEAMQLGLAECDFLKATPDSYKFGWGVQTRPIVQVRLARGGAKEKAYLGASSLVDSLRPMKRRVQSALKKSPVSANNG